MLLVGGLVLVDLDLLLGLGEVDVGNVLVAVEDGGDLLQGGTLGLDEDEVDPDGFEDVPALR